MQTMTATSPKILTTTAIEDVPEIIKKYIWHAVFRGDSLVASWAPWNHHLDCRVHSQTRGYRLGRRIPSTALDSPRQLLVTVTIYTLADLQRILLVATFDLGQLDDVSDGILEAHDQLARILSAVDVRRVRLELAVKDIEAFIRTLELMTGVNTDAHDAEIFWSAVWHRKIAKRRVKALMADILAQLYMASCPWWVAFSRPRKDDLTPNEASLPIEWSQRSACTWQALSAEQQTIIRAKVRNVEQLDFVLRKVEQDGDGMVPKLYLL
nr:uncharacterized protein CTRU02_12263 [Colletotrichum truncatum]KAF6784802.1 hypothetical protein CTRU02_12263 [Colletotrichum truncatum]